MASIGRAALLVPALVGVSLLWVLGLWAPLPVAGRSGTGTMGAKALDVHLAETEQAALASWESMWLAISQQGVDALAPEVAEPGLQPAGDTVFMRYRNLWSETDPEAQRRFQLVALANDPQRKLELLAPLLTARNAMIRYRALLEGARLYLRQRALEEAVAAARAALAVEGIDPREQADAHFILGFTAMETGDLVGADEALVAALTRDPGFWDARQAELLVLTRLLSLRGQGTAVCLDRARRVIEGLGALPALSQNRTQLRDMADRLDAVGESNPALKLAAGLASLWSGDGNQARVWLKEALVMPSRLPSPCTDLIRAKAAEQLAEAGP